MRLLHFKAHPIELMDMRIRFQEAEGVYPVREDTLLLLGSLMDHFKEIGTGRYLDMGCGSGVSSVIASAAGWMSFSADRNPRALALTRWNLEMNGLSAIHFLSDLFSGIPLGYHGHFDLISFNPPYLPLDPDPPDPMDRAFLFGGPSGSELVMDFLRSGRPYLAPSGAMVLVFPEKGAQILESTALDARLDLRMIRRAAGSDEGLMVFSAHPSKTC